MKEHDWGQLENRKGARRMELTQEILNKYDECSKKYPRLLVFLDNQYFFCNKVVYAFVFGVRYAKGRDISYLPFECECVKFTNAILPKDWLLKLEEIRRDGEMSWEQLYKVAFYDGYKYGKNNVTKTQKKLARIHYNDRMLEILLPKEMYEKYKKNRNI